ncbi:hypothetical protein Pint_19339 [Pistacia integerrima]|uniref:Uncharacterized protein n=1 Tax=Pistacia integerrima TaxID=434235 RepID=A0ACC0YVH7_9ROSI|nr:hypothetical protein Pint_19339 [Pistacia integerrima]
MIKAYFPPHLWFYVERCSHKFFHFFSPYIEITFPEYSGKYLKRNEAFADIRNYLSTRANLHAKRFKADVVKDSQSLILSMEEKEEVSDEFKGVKVWWELRHKPPSRTQSISFYGGEDEKRFYKLKFHKSHRELITGPYVKHVLAGPPGTGKSTMIAAMANFLNYDVYDFELTTVMDNSELKNLLIETTNKSVIVIEDIDCSLDLTGQREKKKKKAEDEAEVNLIEKKLKEESESKESKVTLSGLLNCIDGLWSACGGERIIVFTTNYVEKLDPALIRRGRMDKHIEMSYCCFDAFKMLAKNYLDIDSHELFAEIGNQLAETNMIPADVAENLMPKSDEDDAETCLKNLIEALKEAKEEAIKKAEEEALLKAEKEKDEDKCTCSAKENMKGDETSAKPVKENGFINKDDKRGEN